MKQDTHPQYYTKAVITCACGNKITTGATTDKITVEICSDCHPFYTGKGKLIDTAGRVERFEKRIKQAKSMREKATPKKSRKKNSIAAEE